VEYDLRQERVRCLQPPSAVGFCGSSWAFAAVGAFEKQLCKLTDGPVPQPISRQWLLNCATGSCGCDGGSVSQVHSTLLKYGSVAGSCLQYTSGINNVPTGEPLGSRYCRFSVVSKCQERRYFARHPNAYELQATPLVTNGIPSDATQWLTGERAVQVAILSYGAVVTSMRVYADFLSYLTGVYQQRSADFQGKSAIQLIGWGVEPRSGSPYWIAEGNWGPKWGENQYLRACSVRDCAGEFCPLDNLNPTCSDSAVWVDPQGYDCSWYTKNDPGCAIYVDTGQRAHCRQSCKTCKALPLPQGEVCGFFRILRGVNHCGVEELAAHTFVEMYSPSTEFVSSTNADCIDRPAWNDGYGNGCDWYKGRQCRSLPDVGQIFNCPKACGTCGTISRVQRASSRWQTSTSNSAQRLFQLSLFTSSLLVVTFLIHGREHRAGISVD